MAGEEMLAETMAMFPGWSHEQLKTLLLALEAEVWGRRAREHTAHEETPMERWWKHGGVIFKDD